jgi:hypothetical protein
MRIRNPALNVNTICFLQVNYFSAQRIITPYALPLFKEEGARQKSTYRQMVKDRKVCPLFFSTFFFLCCQHCSGSGSESGSTRFWAPDLDLDQLVRGMDPDPSPFPDPSPDPDPSIIKQNSKKNLDSYCFLDFFGLFIFEK